MRNLGVALTGASGAAYFLRLIERLAMRDDVVLHLVASDAGRRVLKDETGLSWRDVGNGSNVKYPESDIGAAMASGSNPLDAMVICPASMSTMSAIAYGLTQNLIHRAAAVQLKEERKLILVPRETPISLAGLKAMVAVREAGATVMPACPGFYHKPTSVLELVDTIVDRILDHLELADDAVQRWKQ